MSTRQLLASFCDLSWQTRNSIQFKFWLEYLLLQCNLLFLRLRVIISRGLNSLSIFR